MCHGRRLSRYTAAASVAGLFLESCRPQTLGPMVGTINKAKDIGVLARRRNGIGFTLIELLVVMSIIALLLSILMPALGRARAEAMLTKDQTQVKAIYSGFSFWSPSHNGKYPIPGLEQRLPDPSTGMYIKGRGPEDLFQNDHTS